MKKFLSLLLAAMLVLSMGVAAMAAEPTEVRTLEELRSALGAAFQNGGGTIKLLESITGPADKNLRIPNGVTLDLNGKTLTAGYNIAVVVRGGDTVTVKNGTLAGGASCTLQNEGNVTLENVTVVSAEGAGGIWDFGTKSSVTLKNSNVSGDYFAVYHNGSTGGFTLNAENSTITGTGTSTAIYISGSATTTAANDGKNQQANLTGCTVTGPTGIEGKYTDMVFSDCDITATGAPEFVQNNNGSTASGFAVVSTDNTMTPSSPKPNADITINGGDYEGIVGLNKLDAIKEYEHFEEANYNVTAGTFTTDVTDYVKDENLAVATVGADGEKAYAVGAASIEAAVGNDPTKAVDIKQGSATLTNLPEGTKVTNSGAGTVTANGETVAPGETVAAPAMPVPPAEKPVYRDTVTIEIGGEKTETTEETKTETEANPNTGAPLFISAAACASVLALGGMVLSKKK